MGGAPEVGSGTIVGMPASSYLVPARSATAEIEVRRSRFLCAVRRVTDEAAARAVVAAARREHFDARHHCSAFVLGPGGELERSSDDGEPSGTAGAPMLQVLRGAGLSDVVAVVTRYFGGTLLGTGGLARAYADAVRAALDAAGTRRRERLAVVTVTVGHDEAGRVESQLRNAGEDVIDMTFSDAVTLTLATADPRALTARLAAATAGRAEVRPAGHRWVDR